MFAIPLWLTWACSVRQRRLGWSRPGAVASPFPRRQAALSATAAETSPFGHRERGGFISSREEQQRMGNCVRHNQRDFLVYGFRWLDHNLLRHPLRSEEHTSE